jgi:hypothetical protein
VGVGSIDVVKRRVFVFPLFVTVVPGVALGAIALVVKFQKAVSDTAVPVAMVFEAVL